MTSDFYDEHLRPFPMETGDFQQDVLPCYGSLPVVFRAFEQTTGYQLQLMRNVGIDSVSDSLSPSDTFSTDETTFPVVDNRQHTVAKLVMNGSGNIEREMAVKLASSIAAMAGELYHWSSAVRKDEAELAVLSLGCVEDDLNRESLGQQLRHSLRDGTLAVECQAAALYLLNQETTSLKLRASWGLPEDRLTDPPRPLKGALADLEALLGNAVIINEPFLNELWKTPEDFAVSVCVPVVSENSVLGTIWFYSDVKNTFSHRDMSVLELTAGRIAAELEKSFLQKKYSFCRSEEN